MATTTAPATRPYAFVSQVVSFADSTLERDHLFCRSLAAFVRDDAGESVDVSSAAELTHLADVVADADVQVTAVNNTDENFGVVFPELFQRALIGRMDRNEKVVYGYLDNPELAAEVTRVYGALALARARVAYQDHCPIGELLSDSGGESATLEYKSTLRTGAETGEVIRALETACAKTVSAFLNSREGGTVLIGVRDDGTVHALASDYSSLRKWGRDDRDRFVLHLSQLPINAVGEAAASFVSTQIHTVDGGDLCRVHCPPSPFPVETSLADGRTAFYVRIGNGTRDITDPGERRSTSPAAEAGS